MAYLRVETFQIRRGQKFRGFTKMAMPRKRGEHLRVLPVDKNSQMQELLPMRGQKRTLFGLSWYGH